MANTNNTAAAAKMAAAANTNTAAALAAEAVARVAASIAEDCKTCKDVAARFPSLCKEYGKEDAARIQRAAKDIINTAKMQNKEDAAAALDTLRDGNKIGRAAWRIVVEEEGNTLCRILYESCSCDLAALVVRFADYVGTDKDGNEVAAVRRKDNAGNVYFVPRDLSKVGGYLAALKTAIKNGKRAASGDKTYKRAEVIIKKF